jgi:hypothetical protein
MMNTSSFKSDAASDADARGPSEPVRFTQEQAFELFDSLESIKPEELSGLWRGREVCTGHPLEGLLSTCNWYGKRFDDSEHVFPMVFARSNGSTFCTNPSRMPLNARLSSLPGPLMRFLFRCAYPYLVSHASGARLRTIEFRGASDACMIYDRLAVIDVFRRIDANTLFCIMDMKDDASDKTFFFQLYR